LLAGNAIRTSQPCLRSLRATPDLVTYLAFIVAVLVMQLALPGHGARDWVWGGRRSSRRLLHGLGFMAGVAPRQPAAGFCRRPGRNAFLSVAKPGRANLDARSAANMRSLLHCCRVSLIAVPPPKGDAQKDDVSNQHRPQRRRRSNRPNPESRTRHYRHPYQQPIRNADLIHVFCVIWR